MQIDRVLFPITTLGPGKRIGIWTVGCPHRCYNCSNPELWNKDDSKEIDISCLIRNIKQNIDSANGVTITGGDPFFQPNELRLLIEELRNTGFRDILVYTGYGFSEIHSRYPDILAMIDVLIDGEYIEELNNDKGIMGSSNQKLIILNRTMQNKYKDMSKFVRQRQNFIYGDKIISVGIPKK